MVVRMSGRQAVLRTWSSLCWLFMEMLGGEKVHTQPPIFKYSYFASSFLTHLQIFLLTLSFVLCLRIIQFDILQTFYFCYSLVPLATLRGKHFTDEQNGALKKFKEMSKTTLVNANGKIFVFSLQVQCCFHLHTTLLSQRKKR